MKSIFWIFEPRHRLDLVAGVCDGILTSLTLSTGRLVDSSGEPFTLSLACRVALAGATSGAFIFFAAHYAELRSQLVEAAHQLNMTESGRLATTHLGRAVTVEAAVGATISSVCSFLGAFSPLLLAVCLPSMPWMALAGALIGLMILGICLGWSVEGSQIAWASSLVLAGIVLAGIGFKLKLV